MNVTELARRLKVPPQQLRTMLPELGFDIGMRAIKIDDRTAWKIIEDWQELKRKWQKLHTEEEEEEEEDLEVKEEKKTVELPAVLTVRDFAAALGLPINKVIGELMKNGILTAMNERIDFTTASIIANDLGFTVKESAQTDKDQPKEEIGDVIKQSLEKEGDKDLQPRPPIVVVMGHVDHGKTKLLDTIRKTDVMKGEAGGITQHIGAYQKTKKNRQITFIDTPGHEAFTTMRSRGARIADVAILVVAADDGAQPQTLEALKIIEAAKLPFVVAVNKMDKPDANEERAKRELSEKGAVPEDWGGKVPFVPISAKEGTGIDTLLDVILLVADLDKDKIVANPDTRALGTVIESHVDPGEGPVATVLVQNGTLHEADTLAVGNTLYGKVRAMKDWAGRTVKTATPGMPVKILGFKVAPEVGDIIQVPDSTKKLPAKKVRPTYKEGVHTPAAAVSEPPEDQTLINVVIKADTLGSLEAICAKLEQLQTPEVAVKTVSKGLGNITEGDVLQAEASGAIVYGFHVAALPQVEDLARDKEVEIQTYKIIYELLDDVKGRLQILLKPEIIHTTLGTLKILAIFRKEKNYVIIGGRVEDGKAVKGAKVNIKRENEEIGQGEITELQIAKKDIAEVPSGSECGLKITSKTPIEIDDVLDMYKEEKKERKLNI